jgi:hypothetical protein
MPKKRPNGLILFEGQSALNDEPIVAIATGFSRASRNSDTGDMLQVYILMQDIHPLEAHQHGQDIGICGHCPIKSACYVQWERSPTSIWHAYQRGNYQRFDYATHAPWIRDEQRKVRWGACGEPTALPYHLVSRISRISAGWTGYTHQWQRFATHQGWQRLLMASVESVRDKDIANALGWRTFRIAKPGSADLGSEAHCPKAHESGGRAVCADCLLCRGTSASARDIVLWGHGSAAKMQALLPILESAEVASAGKGARR